MSVHEGRRCGPGGDPGPRRKRNVAEPGVSISRSTYHELGTSNAQFHGTHKAKPVRCGVVPASAAEACSKRAVAEPQSRITNLNLNQSNRSGDGSIAVAQHKASQNFSLQGSVGAFLFRVRYPIWGQVTAKHAANQRTLLQVKPDRTHS